jgi:GTPase SAR1 family protein
LDGNAIKNLPEGIGRIQNLATLDLDNNRLTGLPNSLIELQALENLYLSANKLRVLPDCLAELPRLITLNVDGNPLVSPPPEVTAAGSDSVLEFLRERKRGSEPQWVSKLLVVGEGGVGKTSLVKALAADPYDPDEPSTQGLMIRDLYLDHPDRDDVRMRLSTWDFGGQEIYHATHQFFLTNRSLFVLLWSARAGWEQGKLHYWLDMITARAPESPIVLVATHLGVRPVDLPLTELRAKYPNIVAMVNVDNASREGLDEVRELLARQAARLPLMGSEWPTTWLAAADALRGTAENHISPERMWGIMAGAGVADGQRQKFIARALHELGDILYYADDPELNEIVVLRPAWVNDYISRVLDSTEVERKHGLLTRDHLTELWRDLDRGIRDHLLNMMDKYDLSYRVDAPRAGDLSLVVERLQWEPPDYYDRWEAIRQEPNAREIKVVYQLNTTPPGIPTWFIARSHRFSQETHWRTGALLGHPDGQHLALISADRQRNIVELAVRGPAPVGFFMVLDDGLNLTLERFPGLHITRRVPCRCAEDCTETFDYDNLRGRLTRTPPLHEIECHRSGEKVSVPELLLGLAPPERDATRASIEELVRAMEHVGDRLDEQSDVSQRLFLRLQRQLQKQQEARCPSVFAVVPADKKRIVGTAYEIHLYCEEPGAWHRLPESKGVYPVTQPREWFVKLGPHLERLLWVLKHTAPLVGPVLGIAVDVLNQQAKSDCDLMKELANQLPKDIDHDRTLPGDTSGDRGPAAQAATDADFRALRAMLRKLDPDEGWGGLSRFDTPEGLTLYLCDQHLRQYRHPGST